MKLTTIILRKIIKEELNKVIDDGNRRSTKENFPVFYNIIKNAFGKGAGNLDVTRFYLDSAAQDIATKFSSEDHTTLGSFVDKAFENIKSSENIPREYNKIMRNLDDLKTGFKEKLKAKTTEF